MKKLKYLFFTFLILPFFMPGISVAQEQPKDNPIPVISNVTPTSFTISWFSRDREDQAILYGTAEPLTAWGLDDRGPGIERVTHHVTLKNLQPNTEYLFRISDNEKVFKQKTPNAISGVLPPLPERFKGKVFTEDKTIPEESNIYMKVNGAQLLSTTSNAQGEWEIKTTNIRDENLGNFFKIRELQYVDFFVRAGYEGENAKKIYAYARENPIDLNLNAPRIPFFKIKLPGEQTFIAEEVGSTSAEPSPEIDPQAQNVREEGLLRVIWRRITEIF